MVEMIDAASRKPACNPILDALTGSNRVGRGNRMNLSTRSIFTIADNFQHPATLTSVSPQTVRIGMRRLGTHLPPLTGSNQEGAKE
jgi:hypothetical protein